MGTIHQTIVFWVSGLTWELANTIPAIEALRSDGATVTTLEPLPITGRQLQARQMLNGENPARTGFFDIWLPQGYSALPVAMPEAQKSLRETIVAAGHAIEQVELALADVPAYLRDAAPVGCLLIHSVLHYDTPPASLEKAIKAAHTWAGAEGSLLLLSECREAPVHSYVNLNNALRNLGILEVSGSGNIYWEETLAYHAGHGQIWLNLEGREPGGIVVPGEEYTQTCQALLRALPGKVLDSQTGEPIIEHVYRRDELYQGDYLFRAPDLVVVLRPGYAPSPASITIGLDDAVVRSAPAGTSAVDGCNPSTVAGLAIATGSPFALGKVVGLAPLASIAPTLLHALRLPVPTKIDAEVIVDLFAPAFMRQFPVQRIDPSFNLPSEDEEEVIARLKSLGYL